MSKKNRAVFFDRDGVLVDVDVDLSIPKSFAVRNPGALKFLPGIEKIPILKAAGFSIFVVSNQPDIALGKIDEITKISLIKTFSQMLEKQGLCFDGIFYCHHHPKSINEQYSKKCECRKPKPGMLLAAANKHGIDLANSWMIGDSSSDILSGKAAGCKTILIKRVWSKAEKCEPDYITESDLGGALDIILQTLTIPSTT